MKFSTFSRHIGLTIRQWWRGKSGMRHATRPQIFGQFHATDTVL